MSDETRICPECAETIKAAAILCRFCKYDFATGRRAEPSAASAPPPPPRKSGMHPLLILVIIGAAGVPIVSIIAAIAIPGLLASQRASNERNAAVSLKTLASAEADFRANDRDNNKVEDYWAGDVRQLYTLDAGGGPIKLIEFNISLADVSPGGTGAPIPKAGYYFAAVVLDAEGKSYDQGKGRNPTKFAFCAFPSNNASGKKTFIINEDFTVWASPANGIQPVVQWPANPAAEGWMKLD